MKKLDIKRALADHGMSQIDLCQRIGTAQQNMSAIVRSGNPTVAKLMQIAEGIGCDITDLFYPDPAEEAAEKESQNRESKEASEAVEERTKPLRKGVLEQFISQRPGITEEKMDEIIKNGIQKHIITSSDLLNEGRRRFPNNAVLGYDFLEKMKYRNYNSILLADIKARGEECPDLKEQIREMEAGHGQKPMLQEEPEDDGNGYAATLRTETFCPHCGKKVRVGVMLLAEGN